MRYYRLLDELYLIKERWFLKGLNVVDNNKISVWEFLMPKRVHIPGTEKLKIAIRSIGKALDFTFADFEVLVVNEKVVNFLSDHECQLIPVEVDNIKSDHHYYIAVLLKSIDCLDESKSVFEKWDSDDPIRPDLAGNYKSIYKLIVDSNKIGPDNNIFRLKKSDNVIIVSEMLKEKFESVNISGIKYIEI